MRIPKVRPACPRCGWTVNGAECRRVHFIEDIAFRHAAERAEGMAP